ncbi:hypothetical protein E3U55_02945 [Filobacillus milosensis]|uniref:Hydrolase Nlp/P60 n=1 Tax=Filobacillus milosensis TaxID=94137 RepID=A0A4Y8ITU9_9BACI|nr:C40 family peptidase [Filobacillus milosensis]TFB24469.1 hypothetical protein E3U55_02945 [Filobacillus milosensis]
MRKISSLLVVLLLVSMATQAMTIAASSNQDELANTAKKYIGIPYNYGGTTTSGFDCSGYIGYVFDQYDIDLPRTTSQLAQTGESVAKSNLQKGDLVFFNTFGSGVSHAGIYIGNGEFIHASYSRGVTTDNLYSNYWAPRYLSAKRVMEKEEESEVVQASYEKERELGPGEYTDVKTNHWAYDEVKVLSQNDIIHGIGQDEFGADLNLTRAQIAALIVRSNDFNTQATNSSFEDIKDKWYAEEVAIAEQAGLFDHIDGSQLNPEEHVTREEVAIMVANAFDLDATTADNFTDVNPTLDSYESIVALKSEGIVQGYTDGTFRPDNSISRAEFALILYKLMN